MYCIGIHIIKSCFSLSAKLFLSLSMEDPRNTTVNIQMIQWVSGCWCYLRIGRFLYFSNMQSCLALFLTSLLHNFVVGLFFRQT